MFARYAGARLPIEGGEVRILNDDEVLGTIGDPESVLHYIIHRKETMPEEAQKKSSEELIDVGETVGAEINLDDKGEPEKVEAPKEEKIEVEKVE